MGSTTTRAAIPYPAATDPNNVPSDMEALANRVDSIYGPESSGTLASRPAYGNQGFKYFATDAVGADGGTGQWFYDTGTRWVLTNPPITFAGSSGLYGNSADPARADHSHNASTLPTVTRSMVDTTVAFPVGGMIPFAASLAAPAGWLNCDGSAVSRTTYAALYAAIGTEWGAGDGSTTFNVPDTRSRTIVGAGSSTSTGLTTRALGATGGEETHVLTVAELAAHNHGVNDPEHNHGNTGTESQQHTHNTPSDTTIWNASSTVSTSSGGIPLNQGAQITAVENESHVHGTSSAATGISIQNAGSGTGHNNMQPYVGLPYIIKAT